MLRNLQNLKFLNRSYALKQTKKLLETANNDPYRISMPLIVSAQLGEENLYREAYGQMLEAMLTRKNQDTIAAWLYGRMLLAANSINNIGHGDIATKKLLAILSKNKNNKDSFYAWALAYYAASSNEAYHTAKMPMKLAAQQLTDQFIELKKLSSSEKKILEARSAALWSWVMISYAASNANDKGMYDLALKNMTSIMATKSIAEALTIGLTRTSTTNEYPAWAISIVDLAAAQMQDEVVYKELRQPLQEAIDFAEHANLPAETAEAILAMTNDQLAIQNSIYNLMLLNDPKEYKFENRS